MTQPPHHVMRFYGNLQYALETIALKQITFLHLDKLNDPFDLHFSFETDFNEDYQALLNYVQQHHPKDIHEFKERLPKQKLQRLLEDIEIRANNFRDSVFIFSTSAISEAKHPKDNLYMWSHYGNGHRGVAIEFDTALLSRSGWEPQIGLGSPELDINNILIEIKYPKELPKIKCEHIYQFVINDLLLIDKKVCIKTELDNIIRERFYSKSIEWETEKEWRLMRGNDKTKLKILRLDLLDDTITAIYFGYLYPLTADHMNDDIVFEAKRNFPKAEIFKMKKIKGKFALDFERISVPANANI